MDPRAEAMVDDQLRRRGIRDPRVLEAMLRVPRRCFVPPDLQDEAYADRPLPIGEGQTISQPFMVARMTELLELKGDERVLEIGTGSAYQTAVLAALCRDVFSVEIVPGLHDLAVRRLAALGVRNVHLRRGDGRLGWPEEAPFAAILVTAAPAEVPAALPRQLMPGGRMVVPVGAERQELRRLTRLGDQLLEERFFPVRFVPLTGEGEGGSAARD